MASIRRLPDRKSKPWQCRIRRNGEGLTEYFRTQREAKAFAAKIEGDLDRYASLLGGELRRHRLAELIDRFMSQYHGRDHNIGSRLAWWREHYGDRPLADFGIDAVREGLARLEVEPVPTRWNARTAATSPRSGPTLNRYRAAISAVYRSAIDRGWFGVQINPTRGIPARKESSGRFGCALSDAERERLLDACDVDAWAGLGVFVRLALATGGRRSELLRLEWRDVDLARNTVLFRQTKNDDDRAVPLIADMRGRLADWSKVRQLGDPRVFPGTTPDRPPPLESAWRRAKARADVSGFRIHDLRHACGTYLARSGASAFEIATVLGHRSGPGLTARYVHLVAEGSCDRLEDAIGKLL